MATISPSKALDAIVDAAEESGEDIETEVSVLRDFLDQHNAGPIANAGQKTSVRDLNGKRLRVGDLVSVSGSCTHGQIENAVVLGDTNAADSHGHSLKNGGSGYKERVKIRLTSGETYHPGVYRVTRTSKVDSESVAA